MVMVLESVMAIAKERRGWLHRFGLACPKTLAFLDESKCGLNRDKLAATALALMVSVCSAPTHSRAQVHLGPHERQTPVCMALANGIRHMPPTTDSLTWTKALPPIRGVTHPTWHKLDPAEHMDVLREAIINYAWDEVRHPDVMVEWRRKYEGVIDQRLRDGIKAGTVGLEETTVPTIEFEDDPLLDAPMELYRMTEWSWSYASVAARFPKPVFRPRWIISVKSLPTTHTYDLRPLNTVINTGTNSSMDVLVSEGRPLFVGMPDGFVLRYFVLGNRFLGNQIATTRTDQPLCDLGLREKR